MMLFPTTTHICHSMLFFIQSEHETIMISPHGCLSHLYCYNLTPMKFRKQIIVVALLLMLSTKMLLPWLLKFARFVIYSLYFVCIFLNNQLSTSTMLVQQSHTPNPVFHSRMNHIDLDYNFIQERVQKDLSNCPYCIH